MRGSSILVRILCSFGLSNIYIFFSMGSWSILGHSPPFVFPTKKTVMLNGSSSSQLFSISSFVFCYFKIKVFLLPLLLFI